MSTTISPVTPLRGRPVLGWLMAPNLMSLDAPAVAVVWHWLLSVTFARSESAAIASSRGIFLADESASSYSGGPPWASTTVLFLTVWLIYMADRLLDARQMDFSRQVPPRHRFASDWSPVLWPLWGLVLVIDGALAMTALDARTILAGGCVAAAVIAYGGVIHLASRIQKRIPKELVVGVIFAVGTCLPTVCQRMSPAVAATAGLLASLFILNCLCVSRSQKNSDRAQRFPSAILLFPKLDGHLVLLATLVCLTSAALAGTLAVPLRVGVAITFSAVGLLAHAWLMDLDKMPLHEPLSACLADYLLLSPVLVLLVTG